MTLRDIVKSYLETPAKDDKFNRFKPIKRCKPNSCHDGSKPYAIMLGEEKLWFGDKDVPLKKTIERAIWSKYECGLHHSHQKRMHTVVYEKSITAIWAQIARIEGIKDFDELYDEIKSCLEGIKYVGPMAYYDFALRIGWVLRIEPEQVYLQQGSLEGFKALEEKAKNVASLRKNKFPSVSPTVQLSALPAEMHKLSPVQAENVLCIYKDKFQHIRT